MSVNFESVTQPALALYMDYPVLEARFPRDFFYPFVYSGVRYIEKENNL